MLQYNNLTIETTVANHSESMEIRNHFKNGVSLKSQMSKGNKLLLILVCLVCLSSFSASAQETAWEITWDFYGTRHQGLLLVNSDDTGLLRVKCWNLYNGELMAIVDQDVITRSVYDGVVINYYSPRPIYGYISYSADNFKIFNNGTMYMQDDNGNWSTAIVMYQITSTIQLNTKMREYDLIK